MTSGRLRTLLVIAVVISSLAWGAYASSTARLAAGDKAVSTARLAAGDKSVSTDRCGTSTDASVKDPSGIHGIFDGGGIASGPPGSFGPAIAKYVLKSPLVCGATFYLNWAQIEPTPPVNGVARYQWPGGKSALGRWEKAGKMINLLVQGAPEGTAKNTITPRWVLKRTPQVDCMGADDEPVFWDSGYMSAWKKFMTATVAWAKKQPDIGFIRFGIGEDDESMIAGATYGSATCEKDWAKVGYPAAWQDYATDMINFEGDLHRSHPSIEIQVETVNGLGYVSNPVTKYGSSYQDYEMNTLASLSVSNGLGLTDNEMNAANATAVAEGHQCPAQDWCAILQHHADGEPISIFPNESTPAGGQPNIGPLPALVTASVTGSRNVDAQILELYANDLLIALDPSWPGASDRTCPGYATCGAAYLASLTRAARIVGEAP
jgi:hypothetical protein